MCPSRRSPGSTWVVAHLGRVLGVVAPDLPFEVGDRLRGEEGERVLEPTLRGDANRRVGPEPGGGPGAIPLASAAMPRPDRATREASPETGVRELVEQQLGAPVEALVPAPLSRSALSPGQVLRLQRQ